jgi:hypothetical protein
MTSDSVPARRTRQFVQKPSLGSRRGQWHWPRFLPTLELLEDRTLLQGVPPAFTIPQPTVDQFSTALQAKLPALVSSSLGNASGIPIVGTALAQSLTTDQLASKLVQDVITNLNTSDPQYSDAVSTSTGMATVWVDAVHEHATETVPFSLPLGSFLTLTGPPQQVTVQIDAYYALKLTADVSLTGSVSNVQIVDGDLSTDPQQYPGVTLPKATMAIVEKATLPSTFSDSGKINGLLPVIFVDHGGTSPVSNYQGTISLNFGTFDPVSGSPTPQGFLSGGAHFDADATVHFADPSQVNGLPFNPTIKTELAGDWNFQNAPVIPVAASPLGTLNNLELKNVQLDQQSVQDLAVTVVNKLKSVIDSSQLQDLRNAFDITVPIFNIKLRDLAQQLGLISGSANNLFSALDAIDAIVLPTAPTSGEADLGSYSLGDPRGGNFSITPQGDVPAQKAPALVTELNQALGIVAGSATDIGLDIPFLTDPLDVMPALFHLALGDPNTSDVNLVTLHLPSLDFSLGSQQPIFIPGLPVVGGVTLQGQVNFHIQADIGYDTAGLRELDNDPTQNPEDLLDGLYALSATTTISALGNVTLSGGFGVFAEGGLFASLEMSINGDDHGTGKIHIGSVLNDLGTLFKGHGEIYIEANVGLGASIPFIGAVGPSFTVGHKDLYVFKQQSNGDRGTLIYPTAGDHILMLDMSKVPAVNPSDPLDLPEVTVRPFDWQLIKAGSLDLFSGIEVDYPSLTDDPGFTQLYIERDSDGLYNSYYDALATSGPALAADIVDVSNPFGEAILPAGDTPQVILVGGPGDDVYVYHDVASVKVKPNVLFIGGGGDNSLTGATLAFGGFIPSTPATLQTQAEAYIPSLAGDGTALSMDDAVAAGTISGEIKGAESDTAISGTDTLIATGSATMVGSTGINFFDETGGGDFQFYGGTGRNNFTVRPSVGGQKATFTIHGVGDPANNQLAVIQGDDPTVTASALSINVQASSVADETNPAKKALAIDDGTQPPFVIAHDVGNVTVDPASSTIPVTTGIGKLTGTSVENVTYDPSPTPGRVGDSVKFVGTAAPDAFTVDGTSIPKVYPLPSLSYVNGKLVMDPRPVLTQVSITYGDDHSSATFVLFGMQQADHLVLDGEAGRDTYDLTLNVGTYFTTDIQDTDQSTPSGPAPTTPDLTVQAVAGIDYERQDKLSLTDTSAEFDYHVARAPNLVYYADGIPMDTPAERSRAVGLFQSFYAFGDSDGLVPQVSAAVSYSPVVNWSSSIQSVAILSGGTFAQINVDLAKVSTAITLTMEPTSVNNLPYAQMSAYADRYNAGLGVIHPLELLDPRATVDVTNAGNFTFDDRVGGSTINVEANSGTFTLAGTTTSPAASAVVAADVAAGASLADTVNILANTGFLMLDHNGAGLANYGYVGNPEQINVGNQGSLAGFKGAAFLLSQGDLVAVDIDDSQDTVTGTPWTIDQLGVTNPSFSFDFSAFIARFDPEDLTLTSLTLNVDADSSVDVQGSPLPFTATPSWTVNGVDVNNTLQGPDKTNSWQINLPDGGVLNDPLNFKGFNNITGGSQADTFAIQNGGTISGIVDGGAGINALDYSGYTGTVSVNLPAGQATGVGTVRNVAMAGPLITQPANQTNTEGDQISLPTATGLFGGSPTYAAAGLPPDLKIDSASGVISGTLTSADVSATAYQLTETASEGTNSQQVMFSWTVNAAITVANPGPQSSTDSQPIATLAIRANDARGGTLAYSDNGTLPPGLTIDSSTGKITGTPSSTADSQSPYAVTITASDGTYQGATQFTWSVTTPASTATYVLIPLSSGQSAVINNQYSPLMVRLVDQNGNGVPNVQITFMVPVRFNTVTGGPNGPNSGPGGSFKPDGPNSPGQPSAPGVTGSNGVATAFYPFFANGFAGSFAVIATATTIGLPTTPISLTNLNVPFFSIGIGTPPVALATQLVPFTVTPSPDLLSPTAGVSAYQFDWKDGLNGGSDIQIIPASAVQGPSFSVSHTFAQAAQYPIQVTPLNAAGQPIIGPTIASAPIAPISAANLQMVLQSAPTYTVEFDVGDDADAQAVIAAANAQPAATAIPIELKYLPTAITTVFRDVNIKLPAHQKLTIATAKLHGAKVVGQSPALEVDSGDVTVDDIDFTTATDAPAVLVTGGSLIVRNSTITATGISPAAVQVSGGSVDLGDAGDPGGNVFDIDGPGNLIANTSGGDISAAGNTFEVGEVPLTSNYRIADLILDSRSLGGAGLVTFVPGNAYVTAQSGSIQRAIDAVADATTIHVETAVLPAYDTTGRNVTILFTVAINPGSYTGNYTVLGQGTFTGPTTLELAPGTYTVDDGALLGGSAFDFHVDALGNVTSLDALSAQGGLGTLSFLTANVVINPGAYSGSYTVSPFGTEAFSGSQTFSLITGLYYLLDDGAGSGTTSFAFEVDGNGNIRSTTSDAGQGSGNTLSLQTILVNVDPGGYTGTYAVGASMGLTGPQAVAVLAGLTTPVTVAGQTATMVADTSGATPSTLSFTVFGTVYTFNFGANRPPTASAGGPYTIREGDALTLNASSSSDPDGDPLTYTWDINGDGVFGDATGVNPTLTWAQLNAMGFNDGPSTLLVRVEVDDGHGHVVTSTAAPVTINNAPPTTSVSGPSTGAFGQALTFTLGAADPSPADQAAGFAYSIDWGDGSAVLHVPAAPGNDTGTQVTHAFKGSGSFVVQVTATDKDGGVSSVTVQKVTVSKAADGVGITSSAAPGTYGQLVTFVASVTPNALTLGIPTGTITLYDNSTSLGTLPLTNGTAIFTTASLVAGTHAITAQYSGDATFQLNTGTLDGGQTVQPATPVIDWSNPTAINFGTALSATQLNASASTAGTFTYTPAAGTVLHAGSNQTLSVSFTPTDTTDYTSATAAVQLTVNQVTPTITWMAPTAITYGTALSGTQLDASANTAGNFTYTPAAGTVLHAGSNQTLSVTFMPTDSTDFTSATAAVQLTVNRATPTVTVTDGGGVYNGSPFPATDSVKGVSGSAGSTLEGVGLTLAYYAGPSATGTALSGAPSAAGTYTVVATFVGSTDYTSASATTTFTITPATLSVLTVAVNSTTRVYGAPNPTFTVSYTGFVAGDGPSVLGGQLTFSTTAIATSAPGTYTVSASGLTAANYQIQYVSGTLTIVANTYQIVPDALDPTKSVLVVGGSSSDESIIVAPGSRHGTLALIINCVKQDNIAAPAGTVFSRVRIYGGAGNDLLQVSPLLTLVGELYADSGNDVLLGGGGNNILVGGTGHSVLTGGLGRNLLIGGSAGGDVLIGGLDDNLQIAGSTAWDQNTLALDSIMAEWASSDSYATRVADLMGTASSPAFNQRQNGQYFLNATTVYADASPDVLTGGLLSRDWFFADLTRAVNQRDVILNRHANETVTEL